MSYFYQEKAWGLGNFIMATPMIQLLSKNIKRPVPCFFSNPHIASLYTDCDFIKVLQQEPSGAPKFGSSRHPKDRKPKESDSEAYCRLKLSHKGPIPNTYVDRPSETEYKLEKSLGTLYIAIFHGCLGHVFQDKKDLGKLMRQKMLDGIHKRGMVPVLLGSQSDIKKYWRHNNLDNCNVLASKLSLRQSVAVLSQCDAFISNDTGLYHVAGALDMEGMVFWKRTDSIKNKSTCNKIKHVINKAGDVNYYVTHLNQYLDNIYENLL